MPPSLQRPFRTLPATPAVVVSLFGILLVQQRPPQTPPAKTVPTTTVGATKADSAKQDAAKPAPAKSGLPKGNSYAPTTPAKSFETVMADDIVARDKLMQSRQPLYKARHDMSDIPSNAKMLCL